jgi:hypothetical protein
MVDALRQPLNILALSFALMWLAARIGLFFRMRQPKVGEPSHGDLDLIVAATLTLLGLIIGFSFSMAISRYDLRKTYEEAEANAIGTEYVRADFLPPADATQVRTLLKQYLAQRVLFYETRDAAALRHIDSATAQLQTELWSAIRGPSSAQPTPILGLVASGMNDVLNSQGYTQAAWWNRIPPGAWFLILLQPADRLRLAPGRGRSDPIAHSSVRVVHCVLFDGRHRQSASRSHSRAPAKPDQSRRIPGRTVGARSSLPYS